MKTMGLWVVRGGSEVLWADLGIAYSRFPRTSQSPGTERHRGIRGGGGGMDPHDERRAPACILPPQARTLPSRFGEGASCGPP